MAVSSTSSTSKGIDVPTIVSGLMEVERVPITKIEEQLAEKTLVISSLGAFKAKAAVLSQAAKALETPSLFASKTVSSTNSSQVSASATSAATEGVYTVKVAQTAQATVLSAAGFTDTAESDADDQLVALSAFSLSQGSVTYAPKSLTVDDSIDFTTSNVVTFTLNGGQQQTFTISSDVTTLADLSEAINDAVTSGVLSGVEASVSSSVLTLTSTNPLRGISTATVTTGAVDVSVHTSVLPTDLSIRDLATQINDLGAPIQANIVETSDGNYTLTVRSTSTGLANDVALSGLSVGDGSSYAVRTVTEMQSARDAVFSVNGLSATRSSNQISDVISGVTFTLTSPLDAGYDSATDSTTGSFSTNAASLLSASAATTTTIQIASSQDDKTSSVVQGFVTAFNDLVTLYNTETTSSLDETTRGQLNGDASIRDFMNQLKDLYLRGLTLADESTTITFSSMGVTLNRDGTLALDNSVLSAAIASGLQEKLAAGVTVGRKSESISFTSYITTALRTTSGMEGLLARRTDEIEAQQTALTNRKAQIESRLAIIQERLYSKYAALDALIFKLQNVSDALTSAIDGLVNSQKN